MSNHADEADAKIIKAWMKWFGEEVTDLDKLIGEFLSERARKREAMYSL